MRCSPRLHPWFATTVALALAGTAAADDTAAIAPAAPVRFTTLAPDGVRSEVNAELSVTMPDDGDGENLYAGHFDAQFVNAQGAGAYGRFGWVSVEEFEAVTNLELGGLYRLAQGGSAVTFRGGVVLPTGPDGDDGFDALAPYASELVRRPSDLVLAAIDTTLLRLSVSPAYHEGALFVRADVGLDVFVDSPNESTPEPFYHLDLAAGIQQGRGAVTLELTTLGSTDSDASGRVHALAVGGQYDLGKVTASAALVVPFSSGDDSDDLEAKTLVVGVSAGL